LFLDFLAFCGQAALDRLHGCLRVLAWHYTDE
jgi:hypothetical protein